MIPIYRTIMNSKMKKIKNWLLNIARRILRQELQDLQNQNNKLSEEVQTLQRRIEDDMICKTNAFVPQSIISELTRILPPANMLAGDLFENLKRLNSNLLSLINVSIIDETRGILRLTFRINKINELFCIYRRQDTLSYNMFGFDTEINTAYWSMDGIKVMSNKDFELILTAIMAQKNALQELSEEL